MAKTDHQEHEHGGKRLADFIRSDDKAWRRSAMIAGIAHMGRGVA